jgi:hypothetical protein
MPELEELEAAVRALAGELYRILRKYEWVDDAARRGRGRYCACCGNWEESGHEPYCEIASTLQMAAELL